MRGSPCCTGSTRDSEVGVKPECASFAIKRRASTLRRVRTTSRTRAAVLAYVVECWPAIYAACTEGARRLTPPTRTKANHATTASTPRCPAITPLIDLNAQPSIAPYVAPVPVQHPTREAWLEAAIDQFRPLFDAVGAPLPERVKVTCGWATKTKAIGQAFPRALSAAGFKRSLRQSEA